MEPVFSKTWKGTEPGCVHPDFASCGDDCQIYHGEGFAENMYDFESRSKWNETHPNPVYSGIGSSNKKRTGILKCRGWEVLPSDPVTMTKVNGKVICGQRGGVTYEQAKRPDLDTGLCPEGTKSCNEGASIQNRLCVPEDQSEELCPITSIEIVDQATGDAKKESGE